MGIIVIEVEKFLREFLSINTFTWKKNIFVKKLELKQINC